MKPKSKTRICDTCKTTVAKLKCQICSKDLCVDEECVDKIIFTFHTSDSDDDGPMYLTDGDKPSHVSALITLIACKICSGSMKKNEDEIYKIVQESRQYKSFLNLLKRTTARIGAINPADIKEGRELIKRKNIMLPKNLFTGNGVTPKSITGLYRGGKTQWKK